jgi:hypothetical protein
MKEFLAGLARNPVVGGVVVLSALSGVAWFFFGEDIKRALQKFNPASDQNLAYSGASGIVQAVTGDPDATLGTAIYEWFNDDPPINSPIYMVTFPGGARHAVDSATVSGGKFTLEKYYGPRVWTLGMNNGGYQAI